MTEPPVLPADLENDLRTALRGHVSEQQLPLVLSSIETLFLKVDQTYHLGERTSLAPEEISHLDTLVPGFAQRYATVLIDRMTLPVRKAEHEMQWERDDQTILASNQRRGMVFGLIIAMALAVAATVCAFIGATEVGLALVGAAAVGMVSKFLDAWRHKNT